MHVLGDLVGPDSASDAIALRTATRAGSYSYEKLCSTAWKAGNLLRHYGVRTGMKVAIPADDPQPPVVTAFLGAAQLGAAVDVDPPRDVDASALVVHADRVEDYDPEPGCSVLGYGAVPDDPTVAHFEKEVWSENPIAPPDEVAPEDLALVGPDGEHTHADLLERARDVVDERGLDAESAVDAERWTDTAGVVETLLAPLLAGATVVLERPE